ncbi:amino acid deaminase [Pusillimonas sp. ANT_WB101]|uniref:amino acid deaminase n=1 Tax=Pusillimonas sp. ANT_WB101 TaxID=2597356 RepID=UPI0011EBEBDA|nr:amino acid deaminase [Pusillimonas sp. ANT_WB101]KAA0911349.1 amino acid deaminase [Pusillimonas sp. ANT_WB101]
MKLKNDTPSTIDMRVKGMPGRMQPIPITDIGKQGWNLLREELTLPVAVLKNSALQHNSDWMRRFLAAGNCLFSPHGKTSMSPQLFEMQINDGAWGITLATSHQVQVARRFGFNRILLANQLVGKQAVAYIVEELRNDPDFDFYCLVDSVALVNNLAQAVREAGIARPLQVFLEVGCEGGRTGCRTYEQCMDVAQAIGDASPFLALRGIEGFEGLIPAQAGVAVEQQVRGFLDLMVKVAHQCDADQRFSAGPIILSAGGSAFYDLVVQSFADLALSQPYVIVTRSGCYLTHDASMYKRAFQKITDRSAQARELGDGFIPALEVWGYVISRPEAKKAILNVGKRDVSHDQLPLPQRWYRVDSKDKPQPLADAHVVTQLDDQHCHMTVPEDSPLQVGDMVQFGISHPCLTFDKWRVICLVDDDYNVTGAVETYF